MKTIKEFFKSAAFRRGICLMAVFTVMACMGIAASADDAGFVDGIKQVTTEVTSQFSIANIASVIGVVLAGCVGLFLFWWGARKVVSLITKAFRGGKISL